MSLKGGPELRARLRAIKLTFKPVGKAWADTTASEMRRHIPRRTGFTAGTIRRRNATQRKATVVGSFVTNFIDAGSKAHDIKPKRATRLVFQAEGRTIFAKKVHKQRIAARPFKKAAALEGLRRNPMAAELINQWNRAAR